MGRPGKYETDVKPKLILVEAWSRDGLTKQQIAENLGIGVSTLCEYQLKYSEFLEAFKRGREQADIEVENALFKKATGYKTKEIKKEVDWDGKEKLTEIVKEVAPDTTAQIFWLKNRKPDVWNDRRIIENTGKVDINTNSLAALSNEELMKLIKEE